MILVRGKLSTVARNVRHASAAGALRSNAAIACAESAASLETQLGDDGHAVNRPSLMPSVAGRVPEQEKSDITIKLAPIVRSMTCNIRSGTFRALLLFHFGLLVEKLERHGAVGRGAASTQGGCD